VDLVTASPYHPEGEVRNVPSWRLSLSKTASFLYRQVLRQRLYTYTSCFRVYRRSIVAEIKPREGGFLGVAEMLGRLDLGGSKIVEYPATLEVRLFGRSKMKVSRTIAGHLGLLLRLLAMRVRRTDKHEDATRKEEFTPDPALKSNYQAPTITHQK
jgi:dolichol-phosphate mannosyltransferase